MAGEIVINRAHDAWSDTRAYVQDNARKGHFSTRNPDHLIRHEIGHALHYRRLNEAERADIWYKPMSARDTAIADRVSRYAREGAIEFVAEVYAGMRGGRKFSPEVLRLYRKLKGPAK